MSIAFAGERGAFAELAAYAYFHHAVTSVPVPDFSDVFSRVEQGKARFGIIPIENSQAGSIHQNYDLLLEHDLSITGEILLRISHFLIANKNVSRRRIKRILSHPQALSQCKRYLKRYPNLELIPVRNTAGAVKMIKSEKLTDAAAIASMQAALDYKMAILAKHIEDNPDNTTRFLVLSKRRRRGRIQNSPMKTSVVFSTKNIPGVLYKCLSVFALRDIDLFKIESRPMPHSLKGKRFDYLFYLDFEGFARDEAQKNALNHLQEITTLCRVLGSYPVGEVVNPEYRERQRES